MDGKAVEGDFDSPGRIMWFAGVLFTSQVHDIDVTVPHPPEDLVAVNRQADRIEHWGRQDADGDYERRAADA